MKLALAILVLSLSTSAMAIGGPSYDQELPPGGHRVQYDSWCQGDRVMTSDKEGTPFAKWDCSEAGKGLRCVENTFRMGEWTVVSATCE